MSDQGSNQTANTSTAQIVQGSVQEVVLRMQTILEERIDRARESLRSTEEAVSKLNAYEVKIDALEGELQELRKAAKELEIRVHKLNADNAALRAQVTPLQSRASELTQGRLVVDQRLRQLCEVACLEVGRAVKALLPKTKGRLVKKRVSISEQAALLVSAGIIDPVWYLKRHPDVAAAGMEAAVHYVLHGAEEGRIPKPSLDDGAMRG